MVASKTNDRDAVRWNDASVTISIVRFLVSLFLEGTFPSSVTSADCRRYRIHLARDRLQFLIEL